MLLSLSPLLWGSDAQALDRCRKYLPTIIRETHYALGMDGPYYYFAGQIKGESRCDEGATAFDGGQGLGQFMPATAEEVQAREKTLRELGAEPLPYDPRWAIRALVLYDRWCYQQANCQGWYFAFRAYNGGAGLLNREILAARSCDQKKVEAACRRRVLTLKNGGKLDLCRVNTEYPYLIFERSKNYRREK